MSTNDQSNTQPALRRGQFVVAAGVVAEDLTIDDVSAEAVDAFYDETDVKFETAMGATLEDLWTGWWAAACDRFAVEVDG